MQNGKGDSPRNCFSREFRENFSLINWNIYCAACKQVIPKGARHFTCEEKHLFYCLRCSGYKEN
jgi:hypothetical protein